MAKCESPGMSGAKENSHSPTGKYPGRANVKDYAVPSQSAAKRHCISRIASNELVVYDEMAAISRKTDSGYLVIRYACDGLR